MELPEKTYTAQEYIETASGNKVCKESVLCGSQNIILNGKTIIHANCIIRGDLAQCRCVERFFEKLRFFLTSVETIATAGCILREHDFVANMFA